MEARASYVAVVERGRDGVYQTLRTEFGERDIVDVIWDRRWTERRRAVRPVPREQRRQQRRRGRPFTWQTLGFVLVPLTR